MWFIKQVCLTYDDIKWTKNMGGGKGKKDANVKQTTYF